MLYAGAVSSPYTQSQYQVRFEWGVVGAETISEGVQAIVWVDQLATTSANAGDALGELLARESVAGAQVVTATVQHAAAIAEWALGRQAEIGDRFRIAVVAAGETRLDGTARFAVEDLLAAGAVVDALAAVGIDYCSPEAAAASAAYSGLRSATGHLVSASTSGQALGRPKVSLAPVDEVVIVRE